MNKLKKAMQIPKKCRKLHVKANPISGKKNPQAHNTR